MNGDLRTESPYLLHLMMILLEYFYIYYKK